MLFPKSMCFFKKPKPSPEMEISSPIPQKYDYANGVVPPYHRAYDVHTVKSGPAPPSTYHTKHNHTPKPPPSFENYWEYGNRNVPAAMARIQRPPKEMSSTQMPQAYVEPVPEMTETEKPRWPSRWTHNEKGARKAFFRNRGLDNHGRLKLAYEEVGEDDWETPDEYYSRAERKAAKRRGEWSSNY